MYRKNVVRFDLVIGISAPVTAATAVYPPTTNPCVLSVMASGKPICTAAVSRRGRPPSRTHRAGLTTSPQARPTNYERSGGGNEYARTSDHGHGHHP